MTITFFNQPVELKATFRSYMIYENLTGKSFTTPETLTDIVCFMYATVMGSMKRTDISLDDFMDYLDEHPEAITEFGEWMTKGTEVINEASQKIEDDGKSSGKEDSKKN